MRCLLFFQLNRTIKQQKQIGFTLLELLVVIALLAIVAGVVITAYDGVKEQGRADATKFDMAELRKALLQFRRDSGSNDFPTIGAYDCATLSNDAVIFDTANGLADNWPASAPSAQANQTDWEDWCASTANFWMLFTNPKDDPNTNAIEEGEWDPDTHRGWNGPYLQNKSVLVSDLGIDGIPSVKTPYDTPYFLVDLSNDNSAAIVSMGADDDFVVFLLR